MGMLHNIRLSTKISSGYAVVLLLMLTIGVVIYTGITTLNKSSGWVNHTYEVIRTAESVSAAMVDMETGQRGFMIAGQDEYLEPYNAGKSRITQLIEQGATLTSDNPTQVERWQQVNQLKDRWLTEAAEIEIEARRDINNYPLTMADIKNMMKDGKGKYYMDTIRNILKDIIDAEEVLIKIRTEEQQAASRFVIQATIGGTLLAIIFSIGIAQIIIRGISRPIAIINNTLKDISQGDLTQRINYNSKDELGDLSNSVNQFIERLQQIITDIIGSADQLSMAAQEQEVVTQDVNRSVESIEGIAKASFNSAKETEITGEEVAQLSSNLQQIVAQFKI